MARHDLVLREVEEVVHRGPVSPGGEPRAEREGDDEQGEVVAIEPPCACEELAGYCAAAGPADSVRAGRGETRSPNAKASVIPRAVARPRTEYRPLEVTR